MGPLCCNWGLGEVLMNEKKNQWRNDSIAFNMRNKC